MNLSLSGGLVINAPRGQGVEMRGEDVSIIANENSDGSSNSKAYEEEETLLTSQTGWGSPPGSAGWSRRPVYIPRKPVQNYEEMVDAFKTSLPFTLAARGTGPKVPCTLCNDSLATRAFLPCSHACVCDSCMKAAGIGPMRVKEGEGLGGGATGGDPAGAASAAAARGGSDYLSWDICPICSATILAVVPCGAVQDPKVRGRVEDIMVSVAGPAQVIKKEDLVAAGYGPLGPGFGGSEGPVSHRFRVLFGRSAKALTAFAENGAQRGGVPTSSDIKKANWDDGKPPWLGAAEWTWVRFLHSHFRTPYIPFFFSPNTHCHHSLHRMRG